MPGEKGFAMEKKVLEEMKQKLLARQREILEGLKALNKEPDDNDVQDLADKAAETYEQNLYQSLSENEYRELKMIEQAIEKINTGCYGQCSKCEKDIAPARLNFFPFAARCVSCQEAYENR